MYTRCAIRIEHRVFDQIGVARINDRTGRRSRQTELLVERFEQKQTAVGAEVPAVEVGNDWRSADAAKVEFIGRDKGTLWNRPMMLLIELDTHNNALLGSSADLRW